ncbi:zinc-dependent alcohol dehydrogenase family protein [Geomesophilobacter sediminis]|uniref:NAD(P)-dependent alcohol dehydrogenase n=1 Tax=Geomesophilobacter sediminis TaxID=2798584 RepID=A0A8J7JLS4_9BACT|nr:NAD(P)-dependent alcohol dehydrogenase [Geomesophilobacter sediminis]MBJ6725340.1 NAD(P)-dependent alcohol dehydrogenase [Geomesophilobacter sediminis]
MKAIRLKGSGGLERLTMVEAQEPGPPQQGEILVRLLANSLNYHDYLVALGKIRTAEGLIPLSDGAGIVESVGKGVTEFAVGDHVVSCFFPEWQNGEPVPSAVAKVPGDSSDGYAQEKVVRPAHWFTRAPKNYNHAEAATLPTAALTAWRALVSDGPLKAGETVLTLGTGGVSIFALQFAKMMGAVTIVTSSSDEKLARARTLSADHTINYKTYPNWSDQVLELTRGRGVDHVIEVGGPDTLPQSIRASRIGGHIEYIGVLTGFSGPIPTVELLARQVRLQGIQVGSRQQQIEMIRALDANDVKPAIDKTFPLKNLFEAFQYEAAGAHFGKICIEIAG